MKPRHRRPRLALTRLDLTRSAKPAWSETDVEIMVARTMYLMRNDPGTPAQKEALVRQALRGDD